MACVSDRLQFAVAFVNCTGMLDHPITVVLNDFDTLKNNGLKFVSL